MARETARTVGRSEVPRLRIGTLSSRGGVGADGAAPGRPCRRRLVVRCGPAAEMLRPWETVPARPVQAPASARTAYAVADVHGVNRDVTMVLT